MNVPFTLRKSESPGAATAFLLLAEEPAALLTVCSRLASVLPQTLREWFALPPIHAVSGGFLVKFGCPIAENIPEAIRLRALSSNLFVPVDAELVPTLLDDEAAGLVRERGLIFLPGGRVLAFAPDAFITADMLLSLPRLPQRHWQAFPQRPPLAERLGEVLLELEDDTPGLILESGGEGIGEAMPRPADSGPIARTLGRTALEAGRGIAWLGQLLHWPGLAKLGAALIGESLRSVPRLSEALLGKQEAALRELLRKFRSGNLDEALRHALPFSDSPGRGGQAANNAQLPTHGLLYGLAALHGSVGGAASWWFTSADTQAELTREYRKAAEKAVAVGDYRRAAFIYGKLLGDFRSAAASLERGGLHHDAAILYLELLKDTLAAARAFEAAGETDRALHLYLQRGDYVAAGDLLRRRGDDEKALVYYLEAADQLAAGDNPLGAAELLFDRAQRPDLALGFLARGWVRRPHGSAIPCLLRLLQWHAEQDEQKAFLTLTAEAEEFFASPVENEHGAIQFFNALAQHADRDNLAAIRDDLRDRSLCGLAKRLRQRSLVDVHAGTTISTLFGASGLWNAALVRDADFALKTALKKRDRSTTRAVVTPMGHLRLGEGAVTAVCAARTSGRVFVGFHCGPIVCFHPQTESLVTLAPYAKQATVLALAANDEGDRLLALVETPDDCLLLSYKIAKSGWGLLAERSVSSSGPRWLTPLAGGSGNSIFGFWKGDNLDVLDGEDLVSLVSDLVPWPEKETRMGLVLPSGSHAVSVCLFVGESVWCKNIRGDQGSLLHLGWRPGSRLRGLCSPPPLSWLRRDSATLGIVGIDEDDSIHWTEINFGDPQNPVLGGGASTRLPALYRAAALVNPGIIAGVYDGGVDWLRRRGHDLHPSSATLLPLPDAVACFPSLVTRELLVVSVHGSLTRVPLPS